jgi:hypothetical protein
MQNATFESFLNVGTGTLPVSRDATVESFQNLGAGTLPVSRDATVESYENLGAGAMTQTIIQRPRGWGMTMHTNTVTVVGDPDATTDNMINVT